MVKNRRSFLFTVTDLKDHCYCPRYLYFNYVQRLPRRRTGLMRYGMERHQEIERLERNFSLARFGLATGEMIFGENLTSQELFLSGELDLAIHTMDAIYPVEFKFTEDERQRPDYLMQLAAYAMLLTESHGKRSEMGFLYFLPSERIIPILLEEWKAQVEVTLREMRRIIATEHFPAPASPPEKCGDCQWRNFCGDV